MSETAIGWADRVWNPVTGCSKVSPGCNNCYAESQSARLQRMGVAKYGAGFDRVTAHPDTLRIPDHWHEPAVIFVNSMSDLFHRDVPPDFITSVWETMMRARHHIYLVLTKRPHRMAHIIRVRHLPTPPHIRLGVSAENQAMADSRIPPLLGLETEHPFVSAEPLLEPVDLRVWLHPGGIDWVIAGAESGPGRRDFDPAWAADIRDQCAAAGVDYFHKQGAHHRPGQNRLLDGREHNARPHAR